MVIYLFLISKIIENFSYSVNCIFFGFFLHFFCARKSVFNADLFILKNVQNFEKNVQNLEGTQADRAAQRQCLGAHRGT